MKKIPPFNEPARDILIQNERLADYQDRLLSECGYKVIRLTPDEAVTELSKLCDPALIFEEHLYFSREFVMEFLEKSKGQTTRACLKKGIYSVQLAVLQDVPQTENYLAYPLYYTEKPDFPFGRVEDVPESVTDIIIDVDEYFQEGSFPTHMLNKDNFKYSITTRPIVALTEPLHIGLANIAANFARVSRLRKPSVWGTFQGNLGRADRFQSKQIKNQKPHTFSRLCHITNC